MRTKQTLPLPSHQTSAVHRAIEHTHTHTHTDRQTALETSHNTPCSFSKTNCCVSSFVLRLHTRHSSALCSGGLVTHAHTPLARTHNTVLCISLCVACTHALPHPCAPEAW